MGAPEDFDDIVWLRDQRFHRIVLSSRAAKRRQRVVDIAQRRGGGPAAA